MSPQEPIRSEKQGDGEEYGPGPIHRGRHHRHDGREWQDHHKKMHQQRANMFTGTPMPAGILHGPYSTFLWVSLYHRKELMGRV
ncbi:hypothetical protein LTR56_008343 [Elasticomyces elasticus]|nr:hypothetical protein LTR56_008343 [Elasticomyces elasticus]KAK3661479.1 hypothetical protein LTR22_007489 [Elasticomyces elasticus]KAK4926163.1 hypothetical protein LTR49_006867 [Elasticomyces elasticus]KAK5756900.1 hypothetical protein LTS12_012979 [Elasticomyces elasticus]